MSYADEEDDGAFTWGADGGKSSIARRRALAAALAAKGMDTSPVQHWTQGAARVAQALAGALQGMYADQDEKALKTADDASWATAMSGMGSGFATAPTASAGGGDGSAPVTAKAVVAPEEFQSLLASSGVQDPAMAQYLTRLAGKESSFRADNVSPTGAKGLFQFTRGTGSRYGLVGENGDMRADPALNMQAAIKLTNDNRAGLARALGREPTWGETALAHQQGLGGALALLSGRSVAPGNLSVNGVDPRTDPRAAAHKIMSYYDMPGDMPAGAPAAVAGPGAPTGIPLPPARPGDGLRAYPDQTGSINPAPQAGMTTPYEEAPANPAMVASAGMVSDAPQPGVTAGQPLPDPLTMPPVSDAQLQASLQQSGVVAPGAPVSTAPGATASPAGASPVPVSSVPGPAAAAPLAPAPVAQPSLPAQQAVPAPLPISHQGSNSSWIMPQADGRIVGPRTSLAFNTGANPSTVPPPVAAGGAPGAPAMAAAPGAPMAAPGAPQGVPGQAPGAPMAADPSNPMAKFQNPRVQALMSVLATTQDPRRKMMAGYLLKSMLADPKVDYQSDGQGNILAMDPTGRAPPQIVYTTPQSTRLATPEQKRAAGVPVDAPYQVDKTGEIKPVTIPNQVTAEKLRDTIVTQPIVRAVSTARSAYQTMYESADDNTGASDLAFGYGFAQVMDPNSIVRSEEQEKAGQVGSVASTVQGIIQRYTGGQGITAENREQLMRVARRKVNAVRTEALQTLSPFRSAGKRANIDEADFLPGGLEDELPEWKAPAAKGPPGVQTSEDPAKAPTFGAPVRPGEVPVTPKSQEEYDRLPSGTLLRDKDNKLGRKP